MENTDQDNPNIHAMGLSIYVSSELATVQHMGVDHCRADVPVFQKFLDCAADREGSILGARWARVDRRKGQAVGMERDSVAACRGVQMCGCFDLEKGK